MSEWKKIAPITHAETDGPGRRFVIGLVIFLICIPVAMLAMRAWVAPLIERKNAETAAAEMERTARGQTHTVSLHINGMECAMCAVHIEEVIGKVAGVKSVKADYETGTTEVVCHGSDTAAMSAAIAEAVAGTKYTIGPAPEGPRESAPESTPEPAPAVSSGGGSKPENAEPRPNTP
jgi:copper chaperone CopZ